MDPETHNGSIVKFLANVLYQECGDDLDWLNSIWRLLSKESEPEVFQTTLGTCTFIDPSSDIDEDDYVRINNHMPTDMNMVIGFCTLKLREAIIADQNFMESWTVQLQTDNEEKANILAYFLSILYFLLTIDEDGNQDESNRRVRAFNLMTMLMRLWRKSLPSACIVPPVDIDDQRTIVSRYNGEATLPEGYRPIENLFICAIKSIINLIADSPPHLNLLTNDILYDISIIVRMPVSFTLGAYISRLCSVIADQSKIPVGNDLSNCDVKSTKVDLAFSWIYHLFLNTPANLHETVCDNVSAAFSIFIHLYDNHEEIVTHQNSFNYKNLAKFFININGRIMHNSWFVKAFCIMGYSYSRSTEFTSILIKLPRSICWAIIKAMIWKKFFTEAAEVCGNCLVLLNLTPNHENSQDESLDFIRFKSQLLFFAFSPFTMDNIEQDVLSRHLQVVFNLISLPNGKFFQEVSNFTYDNNALTALLSAPLNIANMVSNHMNINWRYPATNQLIINIWCKLVTTGVVRPRHFKALVLLIENSNTSDLHPCVDYLTTIIPNIAYGQLDEEVVVRIINLLLRHALNPGSTSHAYVRALFHAIFDGINNEEDRQVAYSVANCICNNNSSPRLFQMFRELRLLSNEIVHEIVQIYVTHGEGSVWKLMHRSLQCVEYTIIPKYMSNMLEAFTRMEVLCSGFDADTQLAFFGSMLSIIKYRRVRHLIGQGDVHFLNLLDTFLRKSFQTSHCTSQVQFLFLDLVTELRTLLPSTDEWVLAHFRQSEDAIMRYLTENNSNIPVTRLALFKEIAKTYGDMALRLKLVPSNEFVQLIATRIKNTSTSTIPFPNSIQSSTNWSTLALLFGKICLRETRFVAIYIDAMNHILRSGTDAQKSMIIEAMSDICSIHIENINIMMPFLMEYLARRSYLQVSACSSLLNLLNSGNIRLTRTEYLMLVSLVSTEEPSLRAVFLRMFEENLLPNNSDIILTNFIPMILHFNRIFNHPDYPFDAEEMRQLNLIPGVIGDRCSIYRTLLQYVPTSEKFQLMSKIATDIIKVLHRRRLPHSLEAVNMLTDAYKVIYVIIKTIDNKYDTPGEAVKIYMETFIRINDMKVMPAYLFQNYDSTIRDTLVILLAVLEDIHTVHPSMFQDTFHLIMFLISTFFANVCGMMLSASGTSFSGSIKALSVLFDRYKHSFESYNADIYKF